MLQSDAQLFSKQKQNIAHQNVHSHKNSLIPFHITQAMFKKIQFVKDILHKTVNRAQSVGLEKNPVKLFSISVLVYTAFFCCFGSNGDSLQIYKCYLYSLHRQLVSKAIKYDIGFHVHLELEFS